MAVAFPYIFLTFLLPYPFLKLISTSTLMAGQPFWPLHFYIEVKFVLGHTSWNLKTRPLCPSTVLHSHTYVYLSSNYWMSLDRAHGLIYHSGLAIPTITPLNSHFLLLEKKWGFRYYHHYPFLVICHLYMRKCLSNCPTHAPNISASGVSLY